MQVITLIPVGGSSPEIISEADFYTALNKIGSVNNAERIITIKEKQYSLTTLNISSAGSGTSGYLFREIFVPSLSGQTVFSLSQAPALGVQTLLTVGGHLQEYGSDYTIAALTLTWLNTDFPLSITDRIIIYYS